MGSIIVSMKTTAAENQRQIQAITVSVGKNQNKQRNHAFEQLHKRQKIDGPPGLRAVSGFTFFTTQLNVKDTIKTEGEEQLFVQEEVKKKEV